MLEGWWQQMCSSSLVSYSGILSMHYLKKRTGVLCWVWNTRRYPEWCVVVEWLSSGTLLCSRWTQPSHMSGLPVPVVFSSSGSAIIRTLRSNDEDGNAKVEKIYRFYEQTTTLNKQTKFHPFLNMVMVPKNSTPGGFAYIRQRKREMIAIKTERTQIHFLSDVLVAVASLDLKVPNGSLRRRRNLIAVSNVCEAAPRFLFDAPNGLNESVIGRAFGFPFNPNRPFTGRTQS